MDVAEIVIKRSRSLRFVPKSIARVGKEGEFIGETGLAMHVIAG